MKKKRLLLGAVLFCTTLPAQITQRERPEEWDQLATGARFMDRFQAMPGSIKATQDTWGADAVKQRYIDNGIESKDISYWGGNILQTADGVYHLMVCGWPEHSPKGHMFWSNSTVYHATSSSLHGPYQVENSIGKGHNPEAFVLADGRVVVYVIDGYYIADAPDSRIWDYQKFNFQPRNRKIIEGLSNLTFAKRPDGSYLMVCRGGGIWISQTGISPYQQVSDQCIYPPVEGEFEDPVVWRDELQYHLIVNDWLGRIAFYQRSKDGLNWVTEEGEAYEPGIAFHKDGYQEDWFKYERAKVFQDKEGRPIQMNFAVIDTIKWEDLPNDKYSSKNICIPLNKGLLPTVLNKEPITAKTTTIELLISAEEGFNPHHDIDLTSLRFGSFTEVNFGGGVKVSKSREVGDDLVVTFKGKAHGIEVDEFAPKLIGKKRDGTMLFGYARLPYVNYQPTMLSSCRPQYNQTNQSLQIKIDNFGLTSSKPTTVEVWMENRLLGSQLIEPLAPYESIEVKLSEIVAKNAENSTLQVKLLEEGEKEIIHHFQSPEQKIEEIK